MAHLGFGELCLILTIVVITFGVFGGMPLKPISALARQAHSRRPPRPAWRTVDWALLAAAMLLASFALAVWWAARTSHGP